MTIRLIKGLCCALVTAFMSTSAHSAEYVLKIDALTAALSNTEIQAKLTKYLGSPATVLRKVGAQDANLYLVSVEDSVLRTRGLNYVASSLQSMPGVYTVEKNIQFRASQLFPVAPPGPSTPPAPTFTPSDSLYGSSQADYLGSTKAGGIQMDKAWAISRGSYTVTIAVLDTGILFNHPDLKARTVPGYSFYRNPALTHGINAGPDASDPGDYLTAYEKTTSTQCANYDPAPSDWHGTRVASVAAAAADGQGIVGTSHNAKILPVRVLGPCGASLADVLDGMAWAGGLTVSGVPNNPNPARVINLSFNSGDTSCPASLQTMVDSLTAANVAVVASAGNENGLPTAPAVCNGVISVGATTNDGLKAGYSNYGPSTTIFAPGGNQARTEAIQTATNTGTQGPSDSYIYGPDTGTSFSAPMVAGLIANMLSVNPTLTPSAIANTLKSTASAFGSSSSFCAAANVSPKSNADCGCTKSTCGGGILNAFAAMTAARQGTVVANVGGSREIVGSTQAGLDGSLSSALSGKSIASYAWSIVSGNGSLANASSANATLNGVASTTPVIARLTVTDSTGQSSSADTAVLFTASSTSTPTNPTPSGGAPTPSSGGSGGGGGGGGSIPWAMLAVLGVIAATIRARMVKN